jgi:hypothetical protein
LLVVVLAALAVEQTVRGTAVGAVGVLVLAGLATVGYRGLNRRAARESRRRMSRERRVRQLGR